MPTVKKSKAGIDYLIAILKEKARTITRVALWRIPHNTRPGEVSLKVGRYVKNPAAPAIEQLESGTPRSELTLDEEELGRLVQFLTENYEPFSKGETTYIPLGEEFSAGNVDHLRALFANPDKAGLLDFIVQHDLWPSDLIAGVEHRIRLQAVAQFGAMLEQDLPEQVWQQWFTQNDWVLGSEFVRILDERDIDIENISDYLMQAYDGFLDIVEIKRPSATKFWSDSRDHGNLVPSADLVKAITQVTTYIYEVEREANSIKFLERVGNVRTVKPRCILLFGRSAGWGDDERTAYRILNASYHNLQIMTYDHVLTRAQRMLDG